MKIYLKSPGTPVTLLQILKGMSPSPLATTIFPLLSLNLEKCLKKNLSTITTLQSCKVGSIDLPIVMEQPINLFSIRIVEPKIRTFVTKSYLKVTFLPTKNLKNLKMLFILKIFNFGL